MCKIKKKNINKNSRRRLARKSERWSEEEIINLYVVYSWFIVAAKYIICHIFCCFYVGGGCDDDKESILLFWAR